MSLRSSRSHSEEACASGVSYNTDERMKVALRNGQKQRCVASLARLDSEGGASAALTEARAQRLLHSLASYLEVDSSSASQMKKNAVASLASVHQHMARHVAVQRASESLASSVISASSVIAAPMESLASSVISASCEDESCSAHEPDAKRLRVSEDSPIMHSAQAWIAQCFQEESPIWHV